MMRFDWLRALGPAAIVVALWTVGCGGGEAGDSSNPPPTSGEVFESDDPGSGAPGYGTGGATGTGGSGGAAGSSGGGAGAGGDPGKTIEEADIIQLSGNRLYALSRYSGLSVIDVAKQDELRLLGYHRMEGIPFEMYLRQNVVLAMFSSFTRYVKDAQTQSWSYVQTSAVVALDASDPADIKVIGEFDIPGEISDSRLVDDVMVVVSYENGYCYNCAKVPRTTVMSLDVSVPQKPVKVDELTFDETGYSYGKRSVMATTERLYIAGPEYDQGVNASTVQIVDISDPSGKLAKGASFEAAGWIESRWQMDEKDGVLRMISQPPQWSTTNPPVVQTFQVSSATQVTPLGSMDLVLPEPERLRSVRFDGNRAYAITFRQTDPLFTVDLTDPANPQQLGELQMPGWVYHMEPRGDRLFALGFDTSAAEGSLNVSIFDVSDMTAPKMLDRVNFGGDWSQLAEDQDRIHKAFSILDSLGLILVPYSAYSYTGYEYYCSSSESGIQLIDFTSDALTKRGVAPSRGRARRALMHQSRLFAVSDAAVETFDIANRDKPVEKAELAISQNVSKVLQVGNKLVRFGADWWTNQATLDVTSLDKVDEPGATTTIELESSTGCWSGWYGVELFADGSRLYLLRDYQGVELRTFDISGDTPVLLGKTVVATASDPYYGGWGYYGYGNAISVGEKAVHVGSTIVVARTKSDYDDRTKSYAEEAWFVVIDASDPESAKVTTIKRPDSLGFTGLNVANGRVVSSRWAPSPVNTGKVRFYLDWLDVSNPANPKLLAPVNVPGSLVSMRADGKRAMTVDYKKLVYDNLTPQQCYEQHGYNAWFQWDGEPSGTQMTGTCTTFDHTLRLIDVFDGGAKLKDSLALPENTGYWQLSVGDDRLWIYDYNYYYSSGYDPTVGAQLTVYNGLESGALGSAQVSLPPQDGYVSQRIAEGHELIVLGGYPARFSVIDADNASAPAVTAEVELTLGYYVTDVTLVGDTAVCSLGQYGVEAVQLN